ncbi:hypothetical protein [Kitasatospora sp. NPDC057198]|uniref:hypothetical protein n=1 Tax=Kitasatospora sp. NPDC057198 TaxID=3346046 RepID=UPI00363A3E8F
MATHDDTTPERIRQAQGLTSLGITLAGCLLAYVLHTLSLALGAAPLALGSVWWHELRLRRYQKWHMQEHPDCDQIPNKAPTMAP